MFTFGNFLKNPVTLVLHCEPHRRLCSQNSEKHTGTFIVALKLQKNISEY